MLSVLPKIDDTPCIYLVEWANTDPNLCGPNDEAQCVQMIYPQAFLQRIGNQQMLAEFYMDHMTFTQDDEDEDEDSD